MVGAPAGRLFSLNSTTATLHLRDGPAVVSNVLGYYNSRLGNTLFESAVCRALGLPLAAKHEADAPRRLFSVQEERLTPLAGKSGRLTASFNFEEREFTIETRLPARTGSAWRDGGQMWRIDTLGFDDHAQLRLVLRHLRATSLLAPYGSAEPQLGGYAFGRGFVLLNRRSGDYVLGFSRYEKEAPGVVAMFTHDFHFTEFRRGGAVVKGSRIDAAWLADAEFVILKTSSLGHIPLQLTLENFLVPSPHD